MSQDPPLIPVRRAYDRWSAIYDDYDNPMVSAASEIVAGLAPMARGRHVLELGCGTGRNLLALSGAGAASVTGCDLSGGMLAAARAKAPELALVSADLGAALPFGDASADMVLFCLVLEHMEALAPPLREARRVLRPGGLVLAAAISRFASTLDGIHARALADPSFARIAADDVLTGEHRNDPHERPEWFTTAYFHHPDELWEELAVAGFAVEGVLAVEGVASFLRDEAWWLEDEQRRAALLDAIRSVEQEPSVLGASAHLLAVGRA